MKKLIFVFIFLFLAGLSGSFCYGEWNVTVDNQGFDLEEFKKDLKEISEQAAKSTNKKFKDEIEKKLKLTPEDIEKITPKLERGEN